MVRAALLHLLRSQSRHHLSTNTPSVYHCFRSSTCGRPISANPTFKTSSQLAAAQIRWASQASRTEEDNKISIVGPRSGGQSEEDDKETEVVYYGPMSSEKKFCKLTCLAANCYSVYFGLYIMITGDTNVILKGAVASSIIFLATGLHWLDRPYIHKLRWQPGSDSFEVEMMSWYATYIPKTITFADIRPPGTMYSLYATFKANGNFYYVDLEHCHNMALLARLVENLL